LGVGDLYGHHNRHDRTDTPTGSVEFFDGTADLGTWNYPSGQWQQRNFDIHHLDPGRRRPSVDRSLYTPTGNFTGSFGTSTLTVNPATLTITANSTSKTYGQTASFAATAFTETGLVNGDTITGVTETSDGASASAAVGRYAIVPAPPRGPD